MTIYYAITGNPRSVDDLCKYAAKIKSPVDIRVNISQSEIVVEYSAGNNSGSNKDLKKLYSRKKLISGRTSSNDPELIAAHYENVAEAFEYAYKKGTQINNESKVTFCGKSLEVAVQIASQYKSHAQDIRERKVEIAISQNATRTIKSTSQ